MVEDRLSPEELLLVSAAALPVLSTGLRSRVLTATHDARTRRAQGRRVLWAAGVLFVGLGLASWLRPPRPSEFAAFLTDEMVQQTATEYSILTPSGSAYPTAAAPAKKLGRAALLMLAAGDDWRLVEVELQSRQNFTRRFQHAF